MVKRITVKRFVSLLLIAALLFTTTYGAGLPITIPKVTANTSAELPVPISKTVENSPNSEQNKNYPFIRNDGQIDKRVAYYYENSGSSVYIGKNGDLTYDIYRLSSTESKDIKSKEKDINRKGNVIEEKFIGGHVKAILPNELVQSEKNYFIGNEKADWVIGGWQATSLSLGEVYNGIDVTLTVRDQFVEKTFTVAPGSAPDVIRMKVSGSSELTLSKDGSLTLEKGEQKIGLSKPYAYQIVDGEKKSVDIGNQIIDKTYCFDIGSYNHSLPLVIDPILTATYISGSSAYVKPSSSVLDKDGNVYVTGSVTSTVFPTTIGAYDTTNNGYYDVFISKYDHNMTQLLASTYIGGSSADYSYDIGMLSMGDVVIVGKSDSAMYPVTSGAYQTKLAGKSDAIITRLNSNLTTLSASTFIGSTGSDLGRSLEVQSNGVIVIVGEGAKGFPTSSDAYKTTIPGNTDVVVFKMKDDLTTLTRSTYIGAFGGFEFPRDLVIGKTGDIFIAGRATNNDYPTTTGVFQSKFGGAYDTFVSRLDGNLTTLVASTYIGGTGYEDVGGITLGKLGTIIVSGDTNSTNFPVTSNAYRSTIVGGYDAYVIELSDDLVTQVYGTYIGSTGTDDINDIAIDQAGYLHLAGATNSTSFQITTDAYDSTLVGNEGFYTILDKEQATLLSSTFLGGTSSDDATNLLLDANGFTYVFGETMSMSAFPVTSNAYRNHGWGAYGAIFTRPLTGDATSEYIRDVDASIRDGEQEPGPIAKNLGAYTSSIDLLTLNGGVSFGFSINYHSLLLKNGSMGLGWRHNYELEIGDVSSGGLELNIDKNTKMHFLKSDLNTFVGAEDSNRNIKIEKQQDNSFVMTTGDFSTYTFNASKQLTQIAHKYGQAIVVSRDANGRAEYVTDDITGKYLKLTYDSNGKLSAVSDSASRTVSFSYANNLLQTITDANSKVWGFSYTANNKLEKLLDPDSKQVYKVTYDIYGRVATLDDGRTDNGLVFYDYDESVSGFVVTTQTDRNGFDIVSEYNGLGQLRSVTDQEGFESTYTYNDTGEMESITDPNANVKTMTYDALGYLESISEYGGRLTTLTYDSAHNLETINKKVSDNGLGTVVTQLTTFAYGSDRTLTSVIDGKGKTFSYTYNGDKQRLTETMPRGGIYTNHYVNGILDYTEDPANHRTSFVYDGVGRVKEVYDPTGAVTKFDYDALGNLIEETNDDALKVIKTYDVRGNVLTLEDRLHQMLTYTYDGNSNVKTINNDKNETIHYTYDGENRVKTFKNDANEAVVYGYDNRGLLLSVKDQNNHTVTSEYDNAGNLQYQYDAYANRMLTNIYDGANNIVKTKDAYLHESTYAYDLANQLISGTDRELNTYTYGYDLLGRMTSVTDPYQVSSTHDYDDDGNLEEQVDNNGNVMTLAYNLSGEMTQATYLTGSSIYYDYNSRGFIEEMTNARSTLFVYAYDNLGQLEIETVNNQTTTYTYNGNGKTETITNAQGVIDYDYDNLNRLISYTDVNGYIIGFSYDDMGNLETITYPGNRVVTYAYDPGNRLTSVTDWLSNVTTYGYNANDQVVSVTRANDTHANYTYDLNGNLKTLEDIDASLNKIVSLLFGLDDEGNVLAEARPDRSTTNSYDNSYQLVTSDEVDNNQQLIRDYDYSYDAGGNVEMKTTSGAAITLTYGGDNRIATYDSTTVTYDLDGNMTYGPLNGQFETYTYDAKNRLTGVAGVTYAYDALGNRITMTEGTNITTFVNTPSALSRLLMTVDDEDNVVYYIYGRGLISEIEGTTERYYHYDSRGNTIALTNDQGAVTDTFTYAPFGEVISRTGAYEPRFQFAGQIGIQKDPNGLYYMRARYYNSDIQRFISRDTYEGLLSKPLTLNHFAYGLNNPFRYVDPSGYKSEVVTDGYSFAMQYWSERYRQHYAEGARLYNSKGDIEDFIRTKIEMDGSFSEGQMYGLSGIMPTDDVMHEVYNYSASEKFMFNEGFSDGISFVDTVGVLAVASVLQAVVEADVAPDVVANKLSPEQLKTIGKPGLNSKIRSVSGTAEDAWSFFKGQVDPKSIKLRGINTYVGYDSNGVCFTYRPVSSHMGPATINVTGVPGILKIKFE